MTRLVWDKVDERRHESGLDHGVLYPPGGIGVVWNGFTSFDAGTNLGDTIPLYIDGVKYMDVRGPGQFSGSLTAFTYPEEFLDVEGVVDLFEGVYADSQPPRPFDLVFRVNHSRGYKLHLFYNLIAVPDTKSYGTITSATNLSDFSWSLTSTPVNIPGYDPTEHFIFDSETLDKNLLTYFESVMFGTFTSNPQLPPITTFMSAASNWDPKYIVEDIEENVSGGTPSGQNPLFQGVAFLISFAQGDLVASDIPGFYVAMPETRLKPTDIPGLYELE